MKDEKVLAHLAILLTVVLWGISFISIKVAVSEVPPITMALIRFTIAAVILLAIIKKLEPAARLQEGDFFKMLLAGCLGITIYFYFENTGVKLTTASSASLITSIIPIIAIIMDVLIFKTRISAIRLLGVFIAVAGTYFVVTANGQLDFTSTAFKGNLFMIGAMLSWIFYTMINKSFKNKYSGLFLTAYQTMIGTLLLMPLSFLEYRQWQIFSFKAFGNILFLAVCCSALCYFLYLYALNKLDVTITTLYLNLVPVVGVISGYLILKETILPIQLLGGIIIIAGILIVNLVKEKQETKEILKVQAQAGS